MDINALFDLGGKVAVVTGGGDGIGKVCCEILAAASASVIVSVIDAAKAGAVADTIKASGGKATAVACNVLDDADLVKLIDTAVSTYGTVNILVNNAGLGGGGRENPSIEKKKRATQKPRNPATTCAIHIFSLNLPFETQGPPCRPGQTTEMYVERI